MRNNWQLQRDDSNADMVRADYDDYGYGSHHAVSIGDEIEAGAEDDPKFGVVVGVIRDNNGVPVCYKVWCELDGTSFFNYIQASEVTTCEPCGSSEWSLGRIGYTLVDEDGESYFYNPHTKDVILW